MSKYLLDANKIIHLFKEESNQDRKETLEELKAILQDEHSSLFVTPLIAYEALRGVPWRDDTGLSEIESILQQFEMLDVNSAAARLASDLYRLDVYESTQNKQQKKVDKRNFDALHFATAKVNHLDILSKDKHMRGFETLYQRLITAEKAQ